MAGRHERPDVVLVLENQCGCMSQCTAEHIGRLYALVRNLENSGMATQQEIDDLTTALTASEGRIQSEISDLETKVSNGQPIDLSGLKAAVQHAADLVPAPSSEPAPADPSAPAPPQSVPPPAPDGSVPAGDAPAVPSDPTPVVGPDAPAAPTSDAPAGGSAPADGSSNAPAADGSTPSA